MKKVITYGTYDMLHYGHIRLLKRAKELGDYLIVGVTSDTFDRIRGKINVKQSLTERIDAVRATGIADEIIIEEYEGQKIDDIRRYNVDIFTVGSDWKNHFDYLKEYCGVVYLDRTEGISSSELRTEERKLRLGLVGNLNSELIKIDVESSYVNGVEICAVFSDDYTRLSEKLTSKYKTYDEYEELLNNVDAVYIVSNPCTSIHYSQIKKALSLGKSVLCESPITINLELTRGLFDIAKKNRCILMDSIKTAYSLAFSRLKLLVKSGVIGDVVSVDATCTSLEKKEGDTRGSLCSWGPFALYSIFSILGIEYKYKNIQTKLDSDNNDLFTNVNFIYNSAVASVKVANGIKSEGELIIAGTEGYIIVPSPWWKTDYFEVRYENPANNKRYFYQLEGEGIRYMIVVFLKSIKRGKNESYISEDISMAISEIMESFDARQDTIII